MEYRNFDAPYKMPHSGGVPGPWGVYSQGNVYYIINERTKRSKKIGAVQMRGINYLDRARELVNERNAALTAPDAEPLPDYYTLASLEALPTIKQAHTANLKVSTANTKVYLSRMTRADGAPYDHQVTVKRLVGGDWYTADEYGARECLHQAEISDAFTHARRVDVAIIDVTCNECGKGGSFAVDPDQINWE